MATTPTVNASDEWTNASAASAATQQPPGVGWECSRVQLGHPVSLAVAPALDLLLNNMKLAFMLHVYGIACLFSVLATYTFFSLINLRSLISSRPFMTSINVFLCMLGASRAAYLMLDPYNLREVMPRIMGALLWDLAFPCLTSAFCLIQLAFLQLTKLKVGPRALREKTVPSLVIAIHFTFVLGINIILGFDESALPFKLLGETLFAVWACVLFASFVSLSGHVRRLLNRVPHGVLLQRDPSDCHAKGIMQLAMLAPYSNLASSVAAALVPTLLAPRLGQGDSGASRRSGPNLASQMARSLNANLNGSGADSGASSGTSAAASAAPPPVIKTEDVDAPTVMVRPATPTIMVCPGSRRGSTASLSRRGSSCLEAAVTGEGTSRRRSSSGLEPILPDDGGPPSRRASSASLLRIAEEGSGPDCLVVDSSPSPTRRKKSLSWKGDDDVVSPAPEINQAFEATPSKSILKEAPAEDKTTAETKLLPTEPDNAIKPDDVTLHSILTHIAYVNRGPRANSEERVQTSNRRRQLREVIYLTSATAIMGLVLAASALVQLYGPYGQLVGRCEHGRGPAWLWFAFQTLCRLLELAMGCAMANVTKQPVSGPQGYLHHAHYATGLRLKRESLYL